MTTLFLTLAWMPFAFAPTNAEFVTVAIVGERAPALQQIEYDVLLKKPAAPNWSRVVRVIAGRAPDRQYASIGRVLELESRNVHGSAIVCASVMRDSRYTNVLAHTVSVQADGRGLVPHHQSRYYRISVKGDIEKRGMYGPWKRV